MASNKGYIDIVRLLLEKEANTEAQTNAVRCVETLICDLLLINNVACMFQHGFTPLMIAEHYCDEDVSALMVSLLTTAAKWRRRRVCVWLSSALSGGDNILYHLPTDVTRICGSYL